MTKQASQADSTIHEDQLLNFLVNTLTGAFGVTLGENAEIDPADIYEVLPEQVEIVVDFHLRTYYGDKDETDDIYSNETKRGTTSFHAYATLYARMKNKRYTLAVSPSVRRRTASTVLAEFLGLVDDFDFEVKAVYVDSELYDGKCLTLMQARNHAYVIPIIAWGAKIKHELS